MARPLHKRPDMATRRSQAGLTLVELMVVVALFSSLASMGAFAVSGTTRGQEVVGMARRLHFGMMAARAEAASDGFQRRWSCTAWR